VTDSRGRATTREVRGRAVVVDRADIDTDQIIPARWLRRVERTGYGAGLFEAWRRDPAFPLNDPRHAGASVLIAGANFGCGSSREHAAWALAEYGFRAIVAPSFADIFRANAVGSGIVPVALPASAVSRIARAVEGNASLEIRIDVAQTAIDVPALDLHALFPLDAHAQRRLLEGLDEIDATLEHTDAIAAFESRRADWLPRVTYRPSANR
jgi:3-isopropylmalate/(R)-2-methylmalate dehydratase small subunit